MCKKLCVFLQFFLKYHYKNISFYCMSSNINNTSRSNFFINKTIFELAIFGLKRTVIISCPYQYLSNERTLMFATRSFVVIVGPSLIILFQMHALHLLKFTCLTFFTSLILILDNSICKDDN